MSHPSHPSRLGKYLITEVLGEGAMGVVYKAHDPDIRRTVALKTIRRQLGEGTEFGVSAAGRFLNEAQAGGRLSHPGIVGVYDYGEDQGVRFIAMEYVEGQSLLRHAGNGVRFTDSDIPGVMCQLLDAIEHAHRQGVWHRDIKPANLIMTRTGRLKVADFGIARIDGSQLTQVSTVIGTPGYMAPEQFMGRTIDHRVDIYSAGVVLYLLLTGRLPFSGPTEALMYKVVHEPPPPPSGVEGANRPAFYDAIVATALAKDPGQRYASAAAFKQALVQAVGQPIDDAAWEKTLVAALPTPLPQAVGPPASAGSGAQAAQGLASASSGAVPSLWETALLTQLESSLARHVGPLASVLVRRAARECSDLPSLLSRLAEHITSATARARFIGESTASRSAARSTGAGAPVAAPTPLPTFTGEAMSDEGQARALRLLTQHIGPIAATVVRRAAAQGLARDGFVQALAAAVADPVRREKLLDDLARLR